MERETTRLRAPIPLPIRVGIGLRRLGKGESFESLGVEFGVGKSTAHAICAEFEELLREILSDFIHFPVHEVDVQSAMKRFKDSFSMEQIIGAIDGCHFEIKAPSVCKEDYFNRKQFSVTMQAVADTSLKFLDITVGYPGSLHDARVFSLSPIFNAISNGIIMTGPTQMISGISVGPLLSGDSAYPLSPFLLTPFCSRTILTRTQKMFNKNFCGLSIIIERAFGLLKNRWRLLLKMNEAELENAVISIVAACVLHNFCILYKDDGEEFNGDPPNNPNPAPAVVIDGAGNGADIRNVLMDHMVQEGII